MPSVLLPSVLWCCWLGGRKGIQPVKNWVVGCWHGYLSGARCKLAYGPANATLPLTVSCFSKIQIGFTFLVPACPGSPGIRVIKRVQCSEWQYEDETSAYPIVGIADVRGAAVLSVGGTVAVRECRAGVLSNVAGVVWRGHSANDGRRCVASLRPTHRRRLSYTDMHTKTLYIIRSTASFLEQHG